MALNTTTLTLTRGGSRGRGAHPARPPPKFEKI